MAHGLSGVPDDRRAEPRTRPVDAGWRSAGTLRPGHEIVLIDIAARGLLIETAARVLPNARVEVQLGRSETRCRTSGQVRRCRVVALRPLRYQAAIALDHALEASTTTEAHG